jgi:hypothetical protein
VEIKGRSEAESYIVSTEEAAPVVRGEIADLERKAHMGHGAF